MWPQVDAEPYMAMCVEAACSCSSVAACTCFCDVIAAYAQACSEKGIAVSWRSNDLCREFSKNPGIGHIFAQSLLKFYNSTQMFLAMSCEEMNPKDSVSGEELCQWRYNSCGPACPVTCQHPHPLHCSLSCVEGCHAYCPPGAKILPIHQVQC